MTLPRNKAQANALIDTVVRLGLESGYFYTDAQAGAFRDELRNLVSNGFVALSSEESWPETPLQAYFQIDLSVHLRSVTPPDFETLRRAVEAVVTVQEVMIDRSLLDLNPVAKVARANRPVRLIVANTTTQPQPISEEADGMDRALVLLLLGQAYATSARLAGLVGPFSGFDKQRIAIMKDLEEYRSRVRGLSPKLIPEELLSAVAASWDEALELSQRFGVRNAEITVLILTEKGGPARNIHASEGLANREENHNNGVKSATPTTSYHSISGSLRPAGQRSVFNLGPSPDSMQVRVLPKRRNGKTYDVVIENVVVTLITSEYEDGQLASLSLVMPGQAPGMRGFAEGFATSCSLALQHGVPLRALVEQLINRDFPPSGVTDDPEIERAGSIIDYVMKRIALDYLTVSERAVLGLIKADESAQTQMPFDRP